MIKFNPPSWITALSILMVVLMLLVILQYIYKPQGLAPWMYRIGEALPYLAIPSGAAVGLLLNNYYHRDWLRVKQANGHECPGCRYPGNVEVGGKCTECGMDFTAEIVERWRQWWSAESLPRRLPNTDRWWDRRVDVLVQQLMQRLRQTRLFSSRSKPTPNPPTPDAPPPLQPDPHETKTEA
ncbi:MAG: hypothetical protein ACK5R9_05675 [bacterium]